MMAIQAYLSGLASVPLLCLALAVSAAAAQVPEPTGSATAIHGLVLDATSGEPLTGTLVRITQIGRRELSHADGSFHFGGLPPGLYTVTAERIGYAPAEQTVEVTDGEVARITLTMQPSAIELSAVVVTGFGTERAADEVYRPTTVLSDSELRRKLSTTVTATLAGEPGISQRYNGPAAAQPVIRGLSGDRILVLEDGDRTGDIASTAPDHAVTIDPLTAERIEVIRGPAALLYGSNALGGVINVIREEVPRTLPEAFTGTLSAQAASVNDGLTGGAAVLAPFGQFTMRAELSGRTAGDTKTPLGTLPSTDIDGYNAGIGGSWIHNRGFAGAAVRDYTSRYGVPGTFNGDTIPGAHAGGVHVELRRTAARAEAAWISGLGPFRSLDLDANFVRYDQDELEQGGIIGTQFRQYTGTGTAIARHRHRADEVRIEGAVGIWGLWKDFQSAGSFTGTRPAEQFSIAGFVFEEFGFDPFSIEVGARYDWTRVEPQSSGGTSLIGDTRTRNFGSFSGSLAALYEIRDGMVLGASLARAFRTPSIEELFSNGPHLASFRFEVGNPNLDAEYGFGADLFARVNLPSFNAEVAVFRNELDNYIFYEVTDELEPRFRRYFISRARQSDALLLGAEGRVQWEVVPQLALDATASYVWGERRPSGEPLPAIPPLQGTLGARYDASDYFLGTTVRAATAQTREGPFEEETDGYTLLDLTAGYRWTMGGRLNTLTLQVENLLDTVWRDHLSVIKEVVPQPGRNIQLLYRVSF